nr:sigma-70 family RNA polymerase sigma factor [Cryobacterium sp. M15]
MSGRQKAKQLTSVLDHCAGDVLRYLQRRVGLEDAADLLGDTMMVAWRRVDFLPNDAEGARMWIFGLARGTLSNHARGERRRLALTEKIRTHVMSAGTAPAADEGSDVRDALSQLNPDLREIVQLVHWEGFTLAQAAQIVGIPAPTARGRYARAKDELRVALGVIA